MKEEEIIHCPGHTGDVFNFETFPDIVDWATFHVIELGADAIVACGHSGLVLAGAVGYTTRVPVFAVRKQKEPVVSGHDLMVSAITLSGKAKRWVWLDDFICSGGTFRNAVQELWDAGVVQQPCPAALLHYRDSASSQMRYVVGDHEDWRTEIGLKLIDEFPTFDWSKVPQDVPFFGYRS